jgi:hypothetical protein
MAQDRDALDFVPTDRSDYREIAAVAGNGYPPLSLKVEIIWSPKNSLLVKEPEVYAHVRRWCVEK